MDSEHTQPKCNNRSYYGVTPPISMSEPLPAEVEATDRLLDTLKDLGLYETEEESKKRLVSKRGLI